MVLYRRMRHYMRTKIIAFEVMKEMYDGYKEDVTNSVYIRFKCLLLGKNYK